MSADVWIEVPSDHECNCPKCPVEAETFAEMNLTYNLSPMLWGAGMPAWSEFMGMDAREAGLIWEAVAAELRANRDMYEALNPPNGWGTYEQAVATLTQFASECAEAPTAARIGGWL